MYILGGTNIKRPQDMNEENTTQTVQHRVLDGSVSRDQFGANKKRWILRYRNILKADYDTINTIYQSYLSTGTAKTWEVTETNYPIAETNVHVDLLERDFSVGGASYISSFDLILTES